MSTFKTTDLVKVKSTTLTSATAATDKHTQPPLQLESNGESESESEAEGIQRHRKHDIRAKKQKKKERQLAKKLKSKFFDNEAEDSSEDAGDGSGSDSDSSVASLDGFVVKKDDTDVGNSSRQDYLRFRLLQKQQEEDYRLQLLRE